MPAHPALRSRAATLCLAALACAAGTAQAQCTSTLPAPRLLVERFISADCEDCWTQPRARLSPPPSSTLVLDWIVPGRQGDDAPLAAAAVRESESRLAELGRATPADSDLHVTDLPAQPTARLRVGQGPAVADYVGITARFTPPARAAGPYRLGVALVEAIPAGTEGTPIARNVVRNAFEALWDMRKPLSKKEQQDWLEVRAMRIPDGAQPERLRVLAWVRDGAGRLVAGAQTRCD